MTLPPVCVRSWNQFNRNFFIFLSSIACVASSSNALEMYRDRVSRMLTLVSESVLKSDIPNCAYIMELRVHVRIYHESIITNLTALSPYPPF